MILRWNYLVFILIQVVASQDLEITNYESEVTKKVGEKIIFQCVTKDSTDPQLKWFQRDKEITSTDPSSRVYLRAESANVVNLVVTPVEANDAGPYSCEGVINGSPQRKTFQLSVYTGIKVEAERKQYPVEKTDALIECKMIADPQAVITWSLPDKTVVKMSSKLARYKQTRNGLIITNITKADDGKYRCSGSVVSHMDFEDVVIDVLVTILPTMTKPPTLSDGISGEPFSMKCEAAGRPTPKYRWYKDESNIELGDGTRVIVNHDSGELKISELKPEDEGKYKCVAHNIGGQASGQADLNVLVPPKIESIRNGSANEGDRASIECVAKGKPAPSLLWKPKGGDQFAIQQPSDSRYEIQENKDEAEGKTTLTLVIKQSKATDIGIYECLADNKAGDATGKGQIMIEFKPNFLNTPYVEKFSWPGSEAEIKCVANGNPPPTVTWKKDKQPLAYTPTTERGERQLNSTIRFKITTQNKKSVFGIYNCSAVNVIGESYKEINLREATKPGMPHASLSDITTTRVNLIITKPDLNGGVAVDRYVVRYLIENAPQTEKTKILSVETRQHTDQQANTRSLAQLEGLKPSQKYIIGVRAGNAVGLSSEFTKLHETPPVGPPYKVHITSSIYGENSDQYRLQWTEPADGGQPITTYTVKWAQVTVSNDSQSNLKKDKVIPGTGGSREVPRERTFYILDGLEALSYYEVTITATNNLGTSKENYFIFRTSNARPGVGEVGDGFNSANTLLNNHSICALVLTVSACLYALL